MVELSNWLPNVFSQASGMEVARLSFLGPFFALSVFAEDNVSQYITASSITKSCSLKYAIYYYCPDTLDNPAVFLFLQNLVLG